MLLELFWIGLVVKGISLMASNTVKHHSADGYQELKMQRAGRALVRTAAACPVLILLTEAPQSLAVARHVFRGSVPSVS